VANLHDILADRLERFRQRQAARKLATANAGHMPAGYFGIELSRAMRDVDGLIALAEALTRNVKSEK
jgi:hypothetical protein